MVFDGYGVFDYSNPKEIGIIGFRRKKAQAKSLALEWVDTAQDGNIIVYKVIMLRDEEAIPFASLPNPHSSKDV